MNAAATAVLLLVSALALARWAIWRGFRAPRLAVAGSPRDLGLEHAEVSIPTVGGKTLRGWLLPAAPGAPLVIVMHGWGANAEAMLPLAAPLRRHGYAVLLPDARSHGRSDQDTFSSMPRFAEDIAAAIDWAAGRPDLAGAPVALLGHSVGGAAALLAASRRGEVRAVASLSAFDHPERVMRAHLRRAKVPYRPFGWLICRYVERIIGHRFDDIAPQTTVSRIACPVLIGHGAADAVVPPEAAHIIHANAANAELVILPGAGHDEPVCYDTLGRLLAGFFDTACLPPPPPER